MSLDTLFTLRTSTLILLGSPGQPSQKVLFSKVPDLSVSYATTRGSAPPYALRAEMLARALEHHEYRTVFVVQEPVALVQWTPWNGQGTPTAPRHMGVLDVTAMLLYMHRAVRTHGHAYAPPAAWRRGPSVADWPYLLAPCPPLVAAYSADALRSMDSTRLLDGYLGQSLAGCGHKSLVMCDYLHTWTGAPGHALDEGGTAVGWRRAYNRFMRSVLA